MKRVISCVAGLAVCCMFALPSGHTQAGKSRVVELAEDDWPVELVGLSIAGQKAQVSDYIFADKDWLKSLTLRFKNKHSRPIVHMRVELQVPKLGNMEYPLRLTMEFGERPLEPPVAKAAESPDRIAPKKEKELKLSDEKYDFLVQYMQENQVDDIEKVKVFVEFIVYDDDMAWSSGNYLMLRDPNRPERWNVKGGWQGGRPVFSRPRSSLPLSTRPTTAATGQCNSPPYRAPALFTPAKATRLLLTSSFITAKLRPKR